MRTRQALQGALSAVTISAILVGVPLALGVMVGWPLPTSMPSLHSVWQALQASNVPDAVIVNGLAVIVWIAWLQVSAAIAIEIVAVIRGRLAQQIRGFGPVQALASLLVAGVLLLASPQRNAHAYRPLELILAVASPPVAASPDQPSTVASSVPAPVYELYKVQRRDNLWQIAADRLGDPHRWPEIFELNQGKAQPDGRSLVRPELIRPGWELQLPTLAGAPSAPEPRVSHEPTTPLVVPTAEAESSADAQASTQADVSSSESNEQMSDAGASSSSVVLASGSVVGIGLASSVGAALVTLRRRRRRSVTPQAPLADVVRSDVSITDDLRTLRRAVLAHNLEDVPEVEPGVVAVGERDGVVENVLLTEAGIVKFADDDLDEARSFVLTHLLSASHVDAEVRIVGSELAVELLGAMEGFEGLRVDEELDAALTTLEGELVGGARIFEIVGVDSLEELREVSPSDRLPVTLVVVRGLSSAEMQRLEAIVSEGKRLGICALVIGNLRDGAICDIDVAYQLNAAEALDIVQVASDVRTWDRTPAAAEPQEAEPFDVPEVANQATTRVHIRVLGSPAILVDGVEVQSQVRGKSLELVAFLATRPSGVLGEVAAATLWPEANGKQAGERFATSNSDVRRILRKATELPDEKFIERTNTGYRLDPQSVSCDLWEFESAIRDAANASGDEPRSTAALERIVATYSAHFCDDAPYEWADDMREHFRRRALDAYTLLSEAYEERGERMRGLAVLERAMALDPYREDVYQRVMRIQCETEQFAAAQRTGELITSRLTSLNLEPSPLSVELIAMARRASNRPLAS